MPAQMDKARRLLPAGASEEEVKLKSRTLQQSAAGGSAVPAQMDKARRLLPAGASEEEVELKSRALNNAAAAKKPKPRKCNCGNVDGNCSTCYQRIRKQIQRANQAAKKEAQQEVAKGAES